MRDTNEARARAEAAYSALDIMPVVSSGSVLPLASLPGCQRQRGAELSLGDVKPAYSPDGDDGNGITDKVTAYARFLRSHGVGEVTSKSSRCYALRVALLVAFDRC